MSRWMESFSSHQSVTNWDTLKDIVLDTALDEMVPESSVAELARIRKVVQYLDSIFTKIDPELTPMAILNNIGKNTQLCATELNNFKGNKNVGHLNNVNTHLDTLITLFHQIPAASLVASKQEVKGFVSTYASTFNSSLKRFNSSVDTALHLVDDSIKELQAEIELRRSALKDLEVQLKNTDQVIQKQTAEFNNQFQNSEQSRAKRFDELMKEYSDNADDEFEKLATKTATILDVLGNLQRDAQEVYDVTINTVQAGAYSGYANEERKKANRLSFLAAFFFILGTGVIIAPEVVNFFRDIEYVWSLQKSLYRVPISIILFVPAFYFAKESSRHRTNEVV